jgi:hypothetical protein
MLSELVGLQALITAVVGRLRATWRDDAGMTTETVIITAVLAALALAVTAIIVAKVTAKANSILLH